jgi:hypothetical protein
VRENKATFKHVFELSCERRSLGSVEERPSKITPVFSIDTVTDGEVAALLVIPVL